jgi:Na+-transporting methylmalonyl-CoA/oxaloacetate decarboxylase gamma subunit
MKTLLAFLVAATLGMGAAVAQTPAPGNPGPPAAPSAQGGDTAKPAQPAKKVKAKKAKKIRKAAAGVDNRHFA